MSRTILVFGANGQVGWELQRSLSVLGTVIAATRADVNLREAASIQTLIHQHSPSAIVNAAAYTAVDKAEQEKTLAFAINATAPAAMAVAAANLKIPLIHYSTDYVYAGSKAEPYLESDVADPLSCYGSSKLAGDAALLTSHAQAVVLRTSWVYAARGNNFLKTIMRLAAERKELRIVNDQLGAPTSAALLADVTAQVLHRMFANSSVKGIYHCAAQGETSWHGYATYVVQEALRLGASLSLTSAAIAAISTAEYPTPAQRPANSRLNCAALEQDFGLQLPSWQSHVTRTLEELIVKDFVK